MPVIDITREKELFPDIILPLFWRDIGVQTEWDDVAGVGTPETSADVTGAHTFRQASQPTTEEGAREGDLWYDTDNGNHPRKLVNGVWTSIRDAGTISVQHILSLLTFSLRSNIPIGQSTAVTAVIGFGVFDAAAPTGMHSMAIRQSPSVPMAQYVYADDDEGITKN